MASHYDILGVTPNATPDDIRRAFRTEAKRLHPDLEAGDHDEMVRLNEAYDTLKDPERRQAYDRLLKRLTLPPRHPHDPAPDGPPVMDPFTFRAMVFQPLDQQLARSLHALDRAVAELAYDLYDDTYIARFGDAVERAARALTKAHTQLFSAEWPSAIASGLNLYRQGIRQAEDAVEDFESFTLTFDADVLVEGNALLRNAREMLDEARMSLGMASAR